MIDSILRPLKDRLLAPFVAGISRFASPNGLSLAAFGAGTACAAAILTARPVLAFGLWIVNRIIDGLDGALARAAGKTSDAGGYLDIMLDFSVYAALPLAMIFHSSDPSLDRAGMVLMAAFYINAGSWMYLAALLEKRGAGNHRERDGGEAQPCAVGGLFRRTSTVMPAGIIEGTETIIFYSLMILLPPWRGPLFWACAGLTLAGAAVRFFAGWKLLREPKP
jgi:phosphatidylglycerophosphate synthase